jgi:transposase-like protein
MGGVPLRLRFNKQQRSEIIELYASGESSDEIGRTYGISRNSVTTIVREAGAHVRHRGGRSPMRQRHFAPTPPPVRATATGTLAPNTTSSLAARFDDAYAGSAAANSTRVTSSSPALAVVCDSVNGRSTAAVRSGMAVTIDSQGTVLSAQREGEAARLPLFDVTVELKATAVRQVRATSMEEAIHRARTDPDVVRVKSISEVSA